MVWFRNNCANLSAGIEPLVEGAVAACGANNGMTERPLILAISGRRLGFRSISERSRYSENARFAGVRC
ncbi:MULTISPECIES: hypothetical protein, partial [unclassified Pseudomonas]|uniref:hypothetical protein n=1 Tax=unclassified Pseudomonas TaxID=196821 RepID=UPI001F5A26D2